MLCLHEKVKMINPIARAGHVTAEGSMIQASSWPEMSLQLASSSWRPACPLCPLPALGFLTNILKVNLNCCTGSFHKANFNSCTGSCGFSYSLPYSENELFNISKIEEKVQIKKKKV